MNKQTHLDYLVFLGKLQAYALWNMYLNWLRNHCIVEMTSPYERNYCSYLESVQKGPSWQFFSLGIQDPIERKTVMKSISSV